MPTNLLHGDACLPSSFLFCTLVTSFLAQLIFYCFRENADQFSAALNAEQHVEVKLALSFCNLYEVLVGHY
uniref:Uncharacterized protein n=1 Tax=Manihot esculenta TaxID=3983 RepID=A0A2C9UGK4_MANES